MGAVMVWVSGAGGNYGASNASHSPSPTSKTPHKFDLSCLHSAYITKIGYETNLITYCIILSQRTELNCRPTDYESLASNTLQQVITRNNNIISLLHPTS